MKRLAFYFITIASWKIIIIVESDENLHITEGEFYSCCYNNILFKYLVDVFPKCDGLIILILGSIKIYPKSSQY